MILYQNYHRHSHYTNPRISDSAVTNQDYARRAVELGHNVISSCEHGWQGNYFECYDLAKKNGLRLLFSCEAYWVKDRLAQDKTNAHIWLGAKNEKGRQAINEILSEANLTGFYGRPRIDLALILSLPADDVWVTTACVAYWQYEDIDEITRRFAEHFGKNFFLEVQYHNTEKQKELNEHILSLHKSWKIPIIMGCDSHYIDVDGAQKRDDFLKSKGIDYPDEIGWYLDYPDGDTAYQRFATQGVLTHEDIMEAMQNTNVFLQVEEYDSPVFNTEIKLPSMYPDWTQQKRNEEYQRLVWDGWKAYRHNVSAVLWPKYETEIQNEIQTVIDTGMADYFIDNYHIIRRGQENGGHLTKTGRGSAVSFITNKLLGFTEVDRIAASVKMYPERFMSTTRILQSGSLPDVDFNVDDQVPFALAQQQILGENSAFPMLAYGTMKAPAAWKLYAKSQDIPFEVANAVSEQLKRYELAMKHADEDDKDNINPDDFIDAAYIDVYNKSKEYQKLVVSWSIAPCSYLLYQGNIRKEIGLVKIKDKICCCMDGHVAEANHFLKNDLLTVKVVDLIYKAYARAGLEVPDVQTLLDMCPPGDDAWKMYATGCTMALNQVEKTGTSARVADYKPTNISELCAFVAAIRPGFKSMYKIFAARKPFSYGVKAFDDLIQTEEMPNSFVLYQEQEMAALNYAGIPMDECYTAIKNIAKKRTDKVLAYKDKFQNGIKRAMIEDEHRSQTEADHMADALWQIIEDSASYSFNASHSYCVSLDSLYSAWLKAHYPFAFYEIAISLAESQGNKDKMAALQAEATDYFKIRFEPFRYGQDNRAIIGDPEKGTMTNKLSAIKGFGSSLCETLYQCGQMEFTHFVDVLAWLNERSIKAATVEPLIKIDYFQQFGNIPTLTRILQFFDFLKQGTAKQIKKERLSSMSEALIAEFSTDKGAKGQELKSYTIIDMSGLLHAAEERIHRLGLPDLDMKVRIQNYIDILGYIGIQTGKPEDRCKLIVTDIWPLLGKDDGETWAYRIGTQSVGTGKAASLTAYANVYQKTPLKKGDVLLTTPSDVYKNKKGYWYIRGYQLLQ